MENPIDKSIWEKGIGKLIKENVSYFKWIGAKVDNVESISLLLPNYTSKGIYEFNGQAQITTVIPEVCKRTTRSVIIGKVYIEEGKNVDLSDIDTRINVQ